MPPVTDGPFTRLEGRLATVETKIDHFQKTLERVEQALLGDNSEDSPGLLKDVDRLKRSERAKMFVLCGVVTGVIGFVVDKVSAFFK